jgi:hypothetical protein
MKTLFTSFLICFLSINIYSQTFIVNPNVLEKNQQPTDVVVDYVYVTNNSNPMMVKFELITNTMQSNGWFISLCTHDVCMPNIPTSGNFGYLVNGQQGYFKLDAQFNGISGTGELSYKIYEDGNPSNADNVTFIYHVSASTGINDLSNSNLLFQNYPNPFNNQTNIPYQLSSNNGKIEIFDVNGKKIDTIYLHASKGILIYKNALAKGVYYYALYDNDKLISTKKMIVQ